MKTANGLGGWGRDGERPLVFVKLGGSVITDKTQTATARPRVIDRLAGEIFRSLAAEPDVRMVLGHGSGSFGHVAASRHGTRAGVHSAAEWRGFAEVAASAARLNRIVTDRLLLAGVPVWSLQPSASAWCQAGELMTLATKQMQVALDHGLVPLVYGDVALDGRQGGTIISTEEIFAYLAQRLRPGRLVLVSDVDGVFESDPAATPAATAAAIPAVRPVPLISPANWEEIRQALGGSHATDVTGGMLAKVENMVALASETPGLTIQIISGEQPGALESSLRNPEGSGTGTIIRWTS
jgi:isopentenyl phosphate kinase